MRENYFIEKAEKILKNLFENYQKEIGHQKVAIFASGGIDSSLIAYFANKYFKNLVLITLHSPKGTDLFFVKILNQFLKKKLIVVDFLKKDLKKIQSLVMKILKENNLETNITQISLATAFYILCEEAKKENIHYVFTGQGADSLFAGFEFLRKIPFNKLNQNIKKRMPILLKDKKRNQIISKNFHLILKEPFLEKEFLDFSLKLSPLLKINKINNEIYEKYLLRKLGEKLGLPLEIILRHKKALQYSTKIQKYLLKIKA